MSRLRVGIVGCGKIFPMHAYSLKATPEAELVAIADIDAVKLNTWTKKLQVKGYADYQEMINSEDLDVIHLCTPHYLHPPMAIYAMQQGVNVVTEKPAAITLADAQRMQQVSLDTQRALVVSFQNRFNNSSVFVKKAYELGTLGAFVGGKAVLTWSRSPEYYAGSGWKGTWEYEGGGLIIDQAIHTLDLMMWILGEKPMVEQSMIANWMHPSIRVEDSADVLLRFGAGQHFTFIGNNYYVHDDPIVFQLQFEQATVNFFGDKVEIKYSDNRVVTINPEDNELLEVEGHKQYWGTGHWTEMRAVYKALATGNLHPKNSIDEVLVTQTLIDEIYDSSPFSKVRRGV